MFKKIILSLSLLVLFSSSAFANKRAPFLIMDLIPHMAMQLKNNWDNKELALKEDQKVELLKIRKETVSLVMPIKKSLAPLEQEVATKILSGSEPKELNSLVDKIASLKVKATHVHLTCVYKTQKVLNKKQLEVLKNL